MIQEYHRNALDREDLPKKASELVNLGRALLAIDKYEKSEATIEKASKIAGVSISKMIDILKKYGVKAVLE